MTERDQNFSQRLSILEMENREKIRLKKEREEKRIQQNQQRIEEKNEEEFKKAIETYSTMQNRRHSAKKKREAISEAKRQMLEQQSVEYGHKLEKALQKKSE